MYKILHPIFTIIGVGLLVIVLIPLNDLFTSGKLSSCGNAIGFVYGLGGLFLVVSMIVVDKKYPSTRNIIIALVLAFALMYVAALIISGIYGSSADCRGLGPY